MSLLFKFHLIMKNDFEEKKKCAGLKNSQLDAFSLFFETSQSCFYLKGLPQIEQHLKITN